MKSRLEQQDVDRSVRALSLYNISLGRVRVSDVAECFRRVYSKAPGGAPRVCLKVLAEDLVELMVDDNPALDVEAFLYMCGMVDAP